MNEGKPIEVLSEPVKDAIMKNVRRRMTPQPVKIRADVELTCFAYDGVLALQVTRQQSPAVISSIALLSRCPGL